jgi:hypothetical protein
MALKYGKLPRRARKPGRGNAAPRTLRVRLKAGADLEVFSLELQKMVARLQDAGVSATGPCSVYVELRDKSGAVMALHDDQGRPVSILDV